MSLTNATATIAAESSAPAPRKRRNTSVSHTTGERFVDLDEEDLGRLYHESWAVMDRVEAAAPHLDLCPMWEPLLDFLGELRADFERPGGH